MWPNRGVQLCKSTSVSVRPRKLKSIPARCTKPQRTSVQNMCTPVVYTSQWLALPCLSLWTFRSIQVLDLHRRINHEPHMHITALLTYVTVARSLEARLSTTGRVMARIVE